MIKKTDLKFPPSYAAITSFRYNISMDAILICPICSRDLSLEGRSYTCINNHAFDLSKEGYLNLLLVNQRSSKTSGDNKEMVESRRDFLEKGFYAPLSDQIHNEVQKILGSNSDSKVVKILDCGCGEGYYLSRLNNFLREKEVCTEPFGMDISKFAIQIAAKKYKDIHFIVSNIAYKFPFKDNTFDVILNIFAPRKTQEFERVLSENGSLVVVFPAKNHLEGLRNKLGIKLSHEDKPEEIIRELSGAFRIVDSENISSEVILDHKSANLLIKMTPMYYWHIKQEKIDSFDDIKTDTSFNIYVFKKI